MTIKNKLPELKSAMSPKELTAVIVRHIDALGLRAEPYGLVMSVDLLRAFFRRFLEPYLRDLKDKNILKDFQIGISRAYFFKPKLRLQLKTGEVFELPLDRFLLGHRAKGTEL